MVKYVAGILIAGWALSFVNRGNAMTDTVDQDTSDAPTDAVINPEIVSVSGNLELDTMQASTLDEKVRAFLYMIRSCEHVFPRDVQNDACYNIFYGGSYFDNMSDHPVITGEKVKVPLSDNVCRAAGLEPGCGSTAAGAYQFIKRTWIEMRSIAPRLPDFSKESQDLAAMRLLEQIGVLSLLDSNDFAGALSKASARWASLPGSNAEQNPKQLAFATDRFNEGLWLP